jgi:hypothetical protein
VTRARGPRRNGGARPVLRPHDVERIAQALIARADACLDHPTIEMQDERAYTLALLRRIRRLT